ncbi:MAG: electron transfer flavoprotein subunit beta/FixA family protein [Chloroflexota bacterium]|nr:MAG: electron transfer flavoprotein subunit beta/FixA family protein [Chloroflexota bacterium]
MRIVVCAKQVLDIGIPLEIDEAQKGLVEDGLVYMLNPADRCAVEEAVRLKEQRGQGEVIVVTLGPSRAHEVLRECLAIGADRALHLLDKGFDDSDPYATAVALSRAIGGLESDLILCGSQSLDGGSSQVGAILAELLGLPQVSAVTHLEVAPDAKTGLVHRKLERGNREALECILPAVLTVESGLNEPRYPSLPSCIEALHKEIRVCDLGALGLKAKEVGQAGSLTRVVGVSSPKPRTKKMFTPDSSLSQAERMKLMMSGGASRKKSGDLFEGEPDYLIEQILRFLRENHFLS